MSLIDTSVALLKVSQPEINKWYTLEVSNVYDRAGNLIDPGKDTTGCFWKTLPLPVELISFTGKYINDEVILKWVTKTEVNNFGFDVERNTNDKVWEKIGFVNGHGNSNSPKNYSFIDKNLIGGSKFKYRLKQIDTDGKFEYSEVLDLEIIPEKFILFQNYPNPFNPLTKIRYQLSKESKVQIKIYDVTGVEIDLLVNEIKQAGKYEVVFNPVNIASGVYLYRLIATNPKSENEMLFVETKKMVLIR